MKLALYKAITVQLSWGIAADTPLKIAITNIPLTFGPPCPLLPSPLLAGGIKNIRKAELVLSKVKVA